MTLQQAYNFIESLNSKTTKRSEIKVYEKFLHILSKLKIRAFSKDEIQSIETELESLSLNTNAKVGIKYLEKSLAKFEKYLKDTFSLITKGYYTNMGIGLGSSFGILFVLIFLSRIEQSLAIALGISIGMIVGLIIGRSMESQAKAAGRML